MAPYRLDQSSHRGQGRMVALTIIRIEDKSGRMGLMGLGTFLAGASLAMAAPAPAQQPQAAPGAPTVSAGSAGSGPAWATARRLRRGVKRAAKDGVTIERATSEAELREFMRKMDLPLTLGEIGIEPTEENLNTIEEYIVNSRHYNSTDPADRQRLHEAVREMV